MDKSSLIKKYNKQSAMYEESTRKRTLGAWRSRLLEGIQGHVLEIAVGAGANFPFYSRDQVHVTAVDFSPLMLERARRFADELQMVVNFKESDIENLDFPAHSFDAVVSTLSLCGYEDPIAVLNQISRWCKPGGRVYLMEHGLSSNGLLKLTQHVINPVARKMSGCHWNRDMLEIVNSSRLELDKMERYWNGVIHLIWARAI